MPITGEKAQKLRLIRFESTLMSIGADVHILADLLSPFAESISVPLYILLMIRWHMVFLRTVLVESAVQPLMGTDTVAAEE